jgi:thiamine pyrophosphokinase
LIALVVANGDPPSLASLEPWLATEQPAEPLLVIAADGGALNAERLGLRPDVIVGDADSLPAEAVARLRDDGVEVRIHPTDKDRSDTELAVGEAIERGARRLLIVGGLGGLRLDHALANLLLLTLPELAGHDVALLDERSSVRTMGPGASQLGLRGRPGDLVSLLPLSQAVAGVVTDGLAYRLDGESLEQGRTRGLSNVMIDERATVQISDGRLAVIHSQVVDDAATVD